MRTSNIQHPRSREAPSSKIQNPVSDSWILELLWMLDVGCWMFFRRALSPRKAVRSRRGESASTFIIVLWIAFGLVSMAIYFAHSMSFELRAADNRVSGISAEQAIEGAARYVNY